MELHLSGARRSGSTVPVALLHALVLTVLIGVGLVHLLFSVSATEGLVWPASVTLTLVCLWLIYSWYRATGTVFDPYGLFLIVAIAFNGGQGFLEVFHLNAEGILGAQFSAGTVTRTLYLVTVSLSAFHLGALVATSTRSSRLTGARVEQSGSLETRTVGWILYAVSTVPTLMVLRQSWSAVMATGYMGLYQRELTTGAGATLQVLAAFLVPGALFLLAGSGGRRYIRVLTSVTMVMYAGMLFFFGFRLNALMPLIAYAWVWHTCVRPIPKGRLFSGAAAMAFVVFPIIRIIRIMSGPERSSLQVLVAAWESISNPVVSIIAEIGGSVSTVAYTLDLVPGTRPFDMGTGYAYAALTVIPNLFWRVHPAIAHGTASNWLIWTVDPYTAALGGGLGYSFIAEAYLNFGWVLGPVFLGLVGYLYARLVLWATRSANVARVAMIASFFAFFLRFSRDESVSIVRPLIWYSLTPYLLVLLLQRFGKKRTTGG